MYFPILRGKQFELIALRELSRLNLNRDFCPVIEPVKAVSTPFLRTIKELNESQITPIVIINSTLGAEKSYEDFYEQLQNSELRFTPCILFDSSHDLKDITQITDFLKGTEFALFVKQLDEDVAELMSKAKIILIETNPQVAQNVADLTKKPVVIINDGFVKQTRNADYPRRSNFSSSFSDFKNYNLEGFGDYTVTGSSFVEGGGPAYVVAIHLTQILEVKSIFSSGVSLVINHFCSKDNGSYDDPAGKFFEALEYLESFYTQNKENLIETQALIQFRQLYDLEHFPGLGAVKKLSISHHIQTIAEYLRKNA